MQRFAAPVAKTWRAVKVSRCKTCGKVQARFWHAVCPVESIDLRLSHLPWSDHILYFTIITAHKLQLYQLFMEMLLRIYGLRFMSWPRVRQNIGPLNCGLQPGLCLGIIRNDLIWFDLLLYEIKEKKKKKTDIIFFVWWFRIWKADIKSKIHTKCLQWYKGALFYILG